MGKTMNYACVLSVMLLVGIGADAGSTEVRYFNDGDKRLPCTVYPPVRQAEGGVKGDWLFICPVRAEVIPSII